MTSIVSEMGHKVAGNESVATCTCGSVYCRLIRVLYCVRLYLRVYPANTPLVPTLFLKKRGDVRPPTISAIAAVVSASVVCGSHTIPDKALS